MQVFIEMKLMRNNDDEFWMQPWKFIKPFIIHFITKKKDGMTSFDQG